MEVNTSSIATRQPRAPRIDTSNIAPEKLAEVVGHYVWEAPMHEELYGLAHSHPPIIGNDCVAIKTATFGHILAALEWGTIRLRSDASERFFDVLRQTGLDASKVGTFEREDHTELIYLVPDDELLLSRLPEAIRPEGRPSSLGL